MIEHRQIERMVPILKREAESARSGRIDPVRIDSIVDFMRTYADRCHHGKEEDILFAELGTKLMPPGLKSIMDGLIEDHRNSRKNLKMVITANARFRLGDVGGLPEMAQSLEALASLYPRHIETEDRRFFIPCMDLFTNEEQKSMLSRFHAFDQKLIHQIYTSNLEALLGDQQEKVKPRAGPTAKATPGQKWSCVVCDYVYDPSNGDFGHGIPPGTRFEDLPYDWVCPICGATRDAFVKR